MKTLLLLLGLAAVCFAKDRTSHPKVQVYSHKHGEFDQENTLLCHVSGFYPPNLSISLLKGEEDLRGDQTDLAFTNGWQFHLTKNVKFTPRRGENYRCRVDHAGVIKDYAWESNM